MVIKLEGKRALVTGGNSGIGEAIAMSLARAGARVAINYLNHPEAAQEVLHRIREHQSDALALQADVSDPQAVQEMFQRIDTAWGGLDILINNAGIDGNRACSWETDIHA